MTRRNLTYAVLFAASLVVAACSNPTAPKGETCTLGDGTIIIVQSGTPCP